MSSGEPALRLANFLKPLMFFFVAGWAVSFLYARSWAGFIDSPYDFSQRERQSLAKLSKDVEMLKEMAVAKDKLEHAQLSLAANYTRIGVWDKAEEILKQMAPDSSHLETASEKHEAASALSKLAGFYRDWGKFSQALPYYKQILELDGDAPPLVARDFNNLGVLYLMWAESDANESLRESRFVRSAFLLGRAREYLSETAQLNQSSLPLISAIQTNYASLVNAAEASNYSFTDDAFVPNDFGN